MAMWAAFLGGALALGVAGALVFNQPSPPPSARPFDEVTQSASATSQGVRVEALGASYSGTETILRLAVTVEDEGSVLNAVERTGPVRRVFLSGLGYEGAFERSPLTSTVNRLGEMLVHLPPFQPGLDYSGTVPFRMAELTVQFDSGTAALVGDWPLPLEGPAPAEVRDQLRVERFQPAAVPLAGASAPVEGIRSRSETRISIDLPAGATMLSQPLLEVGDARLAPRSFSVDSGKAIASFEATPFGHTAVLHLGVIALAGDNDSEALVFDFDELLTHAGQAGTFDIPAQAILDGSRELILRGEQGKYSGRRWVGPVLKGNWHPENGQPTVTDANGMVLDLAHVQVGYEKDANGNILQGTTAIGFFANDQADLSRVTLLVGPQSVIDRTAHSTTLTPVAE